MSRRAALLRARAGRRGLRRRPHPGRPPRLTSPQWRRLARILTAGAQDETGHTFRAAVATTWAPRGHPPVLRRLSMRREVSSLVALTVPLDGQRPCLYARHVEGAVNAPVVLTALRYFRGRIGRPLWVICDHLTAHRARLVQTVLAGHRRDFRQTWLPLYAPDLNPEEPCNGVVKAAMRNAAPASIEALRADARREFLRLGHRPEVLRACFGYAGVHVT